MRSSDVPIEGLPVAVWASIQTEAAQRGVDSAGLIQVMFAMWQLLSADLQDELELHVLEEGLVAVLAHSPQVPSRN